MTLPVTAQYARDPSATLTELTRIGIALSHERDLERLLDRILTEARRFTGAEAGSLYVRERDALRFTCVQNDALPDVSVDAAYARHEQVPISRSSIAGYAAATGHILNLPDVYALSESSDFRFDATFDVRTGYHTRSMLVVPMRDPDGQILGVIQLINARGARGEVGPFPAEIEEFALALASQAAVALANANLTAQLKRAYQETVVRLARAAEFRDQETGEHIQRMSRYCREIARELGMSAQEQEEILLASPLHDVGKIAVPDSILLKPGRLTDEERRQMELHTTYGGEILAGSDVPLLQLAHVIALTHHERWDGSGYPRGLAGEDIPLPGRITAVADVFDALTSARCYKPAIPLEESLRKIREGAGTQFDPAVVAAFERALGRIIEVREVFRA